MEQYADIMGNTGVVCFLLAYFLMQKSYVTFNQFSYLGLNLAGSVLLMISLLFHWNLPAFLLEAAWALISIYGILIHVILPNAKRPTNHDRKK